MDCSIAAVAARVTLAGDGETCAEARISVGAAAPAPFRAKEAERLLEGRRLSDELLQETVRRAVEASSPITDVRATAEYRRMLVGGLVSRAVTQAWHRAKVQPTGE
jgi:carbon-monoxide dehydrogenase medium subunit